MTIGLKSEWWNKVEILKFSNEADIDFSGKAPEVQSLELSFPVTSAHFQNNQVAQWWYDVDFLDLCFALWNIDNWYDDWSK